VNKFVSQAGNLLLTILSVVLTLGLLELTARIVFVDEARDPFSFRIKRPAAYSDATYFSEALIKEQFSYSNWINPPGTRLLLAGDYEGKAFSVRNGLRVTAFQPERAAKTVRLFGGSTVFCIEVPDSLTLPSLVQQKLNAAAPGQYKVENYGVTSINSYQQTGRLRTMPLDSTDIVVFYGGVNESLRLTTGRTNGWLMQENYVEVSGRIGRVAQVKIWIYKTFHRYSRFVDQVFYPFEHRIPRWLSDETLLAEGQKDIDSVFSASVLEANALLTAAGGRFIGVLQPTLLTKASQTAYEKKLLQNRFINSEMEQLAVTKTYEQLRKTITGLEKQGIQVVNGETWLDHLQQETFLDYCHVTHHGNDALAEHLVKIILEKN
jgi:hypothetical protein